MRTVEALAELGWIPRPLVRIGIRRFIADRLRTASHLDPVRIRKARRGGRRGQSRGRSIVEHLRGKATNRLTTDQIMALARGRK